MSTVCLSFAKNQTTKLSQSSSIKAMMNVSCSIPSRLIGLSSIKPNNSSDVPRFAKISAQGTVKAFHNASMNLRELITKPETNIKANFRLSHNAITKLSGNPIFKINSVDKFYASKSIDTSKYNQKLYPIKDITIEQNNSFFINKDLNTNNLYSYVDEGVFTGDYIRHGSSGSRIISDDHSSYIQPSSVFTKGKFRYKCEITPPVADIKDSVLVLRAFAPLSDFSSDIPPQYSISNISLQDPSGNLISQYKDITLRGDGKFATYITHAEVNPASGYSWYSGYPIFGLPSGYTLNLDFDIDCLDDPFSEGFSKGYEDTCKVEVLQTSGYINDYLSYAGSPLSTQNQGFNLNPNNSIRISAIEICGSGSVGVIRDNYLSFHSEVKPTGQRTVRNIYPSEILASGFDLGIFPSGLSSWRTLVGNTSIYAYNDYASGIKYLSSKLQDDAPYNFITLYDNSSPIDSGRLTLKFSHRPPQSVVSYSDGAFSFGGDNNAFDTAELQYVSETDNYFTVDQIELRVVAKKVAGSNSYPLDVIGYSDDGLLNVTSRKNSFLQNVASNNNHFAGNIATISGLNNIDDLGISTNPLSTKNQYFQENEITNPAGDHYIINNAPLVTSTSFQEYVIPLEIYEDQVSIGKSRAYNISPMFENLYIDLYPIPSGASISTAYLVVTYKPSNALQLHTFGQAQSSELVLRNLKLLPSSSSGTQIIHNINSSSLAPLPHAYSYSSGVTTNYSNRWKGVDGNVVWGPFNPDQFSADFYNPPSDNPFTYGYYNFNHIEEIFNLLYPSGLVHLISRESIPNTPSSNSTNTLVWLGGITAKIQDQNIGYRLNNSSIFSEPTPNKTIDWTKTNSQQNINITINDSFDRFVNVGRFGNLPRLTDNSTPFNYKNGFACYIRFTPSNQAISNSYDLFNSGVIATFGNISGDTTNNLTIKYGNGYLNVTCKDTNDNYISISDTAHYSEYTYPLSLLITYNDNNSKKLRIYTDNESIDNFTILRAESSEFNIEQIGSGIVIGRINNNDVNLPIFLSELGLSDGSNFGCNIVSNNPIKSNKQISVSSFFDSIRSQSNNRYKLYDFIDDDTDKWLLGDYNYGHFSADFFRMTKRDGDDYIVHNLNHSGSGYLQISNLLPTPSSINLDGVSYHTQIENDFVRFSLSNVDNNFMFANSRVSKALPRDYNFAERAICVETIIEHQTLNNLIWKDGEIGPKFIVSLYTTKKDDSNRPSTKNLGLINRSTYYIRSSGNIHKLISTFNHKDILDRSEKWSNFNNDQLISEFDHKYYSYDINDMFLQYDIVYPSGSPFESSIKIHAANVKLQDAILKKEDSNSILNLVSSGEKKALNTINLHTAGLSPLYASLNLSTDGKPIDTHNVAVNMFTTSAYNRNANLGLSCLNIGRISSFTNNNFGSISPNDESFVPELGLFLIANEKFDYQILPLNTHVQESYPSQSQQIGLFASNKVAETILNSVNIFVNSRSPVEDNYPLATMNLVIDGLKDIVSFGNDFNLYLQCVGSYESIESSVGLFTINYPAFNQQINQQGVIMWTSDNVGKSITSLDNDKAFLEANDEIRGVDIICYGDCQ
jgi:hypothetical protein